MVEEYKPPVRAKAAWRFASRRSPGRARSNRTSDFLAATVLLQTLQPPRVTEPSLPGRPRSRQMESKSGSPGGSPSSATRQIKTQTPRE